MNKKPGIVFIADGTKEILTLKPNGDIYVRGKLAANDREVVAGLRHWFVECCKKPDSVLENDKHFEQDKKVEFINRHGLTIKMIPIAKYGNDYLVTLLREAQNNG